MDPEAGKDTIGGAGTGIATLPLVYPLSGKVILWVVVTISVLLSLIFVSHVYICRQIRRLAALRQPHRPRNGLDPNMLEAIPVTAYSAGGTEAAAEGMECVVCLSLLREGERVRRLPGCGHQFHAVCIDKWFYSHSTCPICRCQCGMEKRQCTSFCLLCGTVDGVGSLATAFGAAEVDSFGSSAAVPGATEADSMGLLAASEVIVDLPVSRLVEEEVVLEGTEQARPAAAQV